MHEKTFADSQPFDKYAQLMDLTDVVVPLCIQPITGRIGFGL